ncbi:MAG: hydrogenase iron-sulfur subunit [Candidatus Cloacimonadota bacterium]|nr:hydrogenase iron-sulfur subunit [Candidatus Cloacimonadota bacterium]
MKIGVYVCHCGGNISEIVDVEKVAKYVDNQDDVVFAKHYSHMCSEDGQQMIINDVKEHNLDRVLVSACSPLFHGETFKNVAKQAGLNPYLIEMVNIREQCAWVHYDDLEKATEKATNLTEMGIDRIRNNNPLEEIKMDIGKSVLVIGAGIAGIQAALDLGDAGYQVHLVEKDASIGGKMAQLSRTFPTNDCAACILSPKMADVTTNKNITLHTYSEITKVDGNLGNFKVSLTHHPAFVDSESCVSCGLCAEACPVSVDDEFEWKISKRKAIYIPMDFAVPNRYLIDVENCLNQKARRKSGKTNVCRLCEKVCPQNCIDFENKPEYLELDIDAIIVTTGHDVFDAGRKPEYGYGKYENVLIAPEMERIIVKKSEGAEVRDIGKKIAFIQCVGSRDEQIGNEYCSRVCCMYATKLSQLIMHSAQVAGADKDIYVFYTDMRTFGKGYEEYYKSTQKMGVKFIRGRPSEIFKNPGSEKVNLRVEDTLNRQIIESEFDTVVLSVGLELSAGSKKIADILKIPKSTDGFLQEAHPKFRPVDTQKDGIFIAGTAQGPKDIPDSVAQASATAARVMRLLNQGSITMDPRKAFVHPELCDGCGECVSSCPYDTISMNADNIAVVDQNRCKGCGMCLSSCHSDALDLNMFTNFQLFSEVKAALKDKRESDKRIIVFADSICTYKLSDSVGNAKNKYSVDTRIIRVPSSSRVTPKLILQSFALGADAVFLGDCEKKSTPFLGSIDAVEKNIKLVKKNLEIVGISPDRVEFFQFVTVMLTKFPMLLNKMETIAKNKGTIPHEKRIKISNSLQEWLFPKNKEI